MKGKKALTAMLLSAAIIASMLTAAYALDGSMETAKMKNVKITEESITNLLSESTKKLDGIVIITLPKEELGTLCIGKRGILRGEGVAVENLGALYFAPAAKIDKELLKTATFEFTPVYADGSAGNVLTYTFADKIRANNTPIAENLAIETFADVAVSGHFSGIDPDADALTYSLTTEPKLGTVLFDANGGGTFRYEPFAGKTGTDTFTYMATDDSGAVSVPAKVTVDITKQSTDLTYADMDGRDAHYAALVLSENGIFTGKTIGECTYFEPDALVTRAEFIAMTVALTGEVLPEDAVLTEEFLDDMDIPTWCKPFADIAVSAGFVQGSGAEGARLLRAGDYITRAEAAVVLTNALALEDVPASRYYADEELIPAWAKQAMTNMDDYGIMPALSDATMSPDTALTRAEAAKILCRAMDHTKPLEVETSFWGWWK